MCSMIYIEMPGKTLLKTFMSLFIIMVLKIGVDLVCAKYNFLFFFSTVTCSCLFFVFEIHTFNEAPVPRHLTL